jgi:hypothetical protein
MPRSTSGLTLSQLTLWLESVQRTYGDLPLTYGDLSTHEATPICDARIHNDNGTRRIVFYSEQPRMRRRNP